MHDDISLAFFPLLGIVFSSPWTLLEVSVCKLMKLTPSKLASSHSEAYRNTLFSSSLLWNCTIGRANFLGRTKLLAIVKDEVWLPEYSLLKEETRECYYVASRPSLV